MVSVLLVQEHIFWQLYMIELLGLFVGVAGATRVVSLDISQPFDRFWQFGILHKLKPQRYTNAGLKIYRYFCLHKK